jgi:hypothetical protein
MLSCRSGAPIPESQREISGDNYLDTHRVGPVLPVPLPANTVADESKTWLWLEYKF